MSIWHEVVWCSVLSSVSHRVSHVDLWDTMQDTRQHAALVRHDARHSTDNTLHWWDMMRDTRQHGLWDKRHSTTRLSRMIGLFCKRALQKRRETLDNTACETRDTRHLASCPTGLFCRISSLLWGSFAKETYYSRHLASCLTGHVWGGGYD